MGVLRLLRCRCFGERGERERERGIKGSRVGETKGQRKRWRQRGRDKEKKKKKRIPAVVVKKALSFLCCASRMVSHPGS